MKTFTKLFAVLLLLSVSSLTFAQAFGVKAGLNLTKMDYSGAFYDSYGYDYGLIWNPGFHVGVTAEFPVKGILSVESGLMMTVKGGRWNEPYDSYYFVQDAKSSYESVYYLQLPVTLRGTVDAGCLKIFGFAGPYASIALCGQDRYKLVATEGVYLRDMKFGNNDNDDDYRMLDFGVKGGVGVQYNAIELSVSYDLGLSNISPIADNKAKAGTIGISLGYKFAKK